MYRIVYFFDVESELYGTKCTTFVFNRESAFRLCDILFDSSKVLSVILYDEYLNTIKIWGENDNVYC